MHQAIQLDSKTGKGLRTALSCSGGVVSEFRPRPARLVLGVGLGAVIGAFGVGVLASVFRLGAHPLWYLLGLALLLAGAAILFLMHRLASLRVLVSVNGFAIATLGKGDGCRCFRIDAELPPLGVDPADGPSRRLEAPHQGRHRFQE